MAIEKHFNLRVDEDTLKKFKIVCDYQARSMNSQLLIFMRNAIKAYEKTHGKIETKD